MASYLAMALLMAVPVMMDARPTAREPPHCCAREGEPFGCQRCVSLSCTRQWPLLCVGTAAGPGMATKQFPLLAGLGLRRSSFPYLPEREQLRGGSDEGMEGVMNVLPPNVRGLVDQLDQTRGSEVGDDENDDDLQRGQEYSYQ